MYENTLENADFPLPPSQSATAPKPAQIRARKTPNLKLNEPQSGSSIKAAATITYTIDLLRSSSARAISIPPMKTLIFNAHMGRFRSRGEVQSHIIRLRRLFRYPRSEPIARSGRFLARSNYIRPPFATATPISRLRRSGLRKTRPFYLTAFQA